MLIRFIPLKWFEALPDGDTSTHPVPRIGEFVYATNADSKKVELLRVIGVVYTTVLPGGVDVHLGEIYDNHHQ